MKKLALCLLVMAVTFYVVVMYEAPWLGNILVTEFVLVLAAAFFVLLSVRCVKVSLKIPVPAAKKGGGGKVYVHIENKSVLPVPQVKVEVLIYRSGLKKPEKRVISAAADGRCETVVPFMVDCPMCGNIQVRVQSAAVTDYLRLLSAKRRLYAEGTISVLPRLLPAAVSVVSNFRYFLGDSDIFADDRGGDDVSQIFEIRGYRPGDKMQKIHWKLSARSDEMMVREYSDPIGYAVVIFVNLYNDGKYDAWRHDAALEAAASLSWTLIQLEYSHVVAWIGTNGHISRFKLADMGDIYEMTAELIKAAPHTFDRTAAQLYNEKYGAASYHTFIEVNMKPEIILRDEMPVHLSADKLEESLLALNMEI